MSAVSKQANNMHISKPTLLAGAGLYVGFATAAFVRFKGDKTIPHSQQCKHLPGATFDDLADTYDHQIGWDEKVMGVSLIRRWLIRQAKGNVLEVSAGTGRNIAYYNPEMVTAVTMTDGSKHMLWHAQQKHSQQNAKLPIRFGLADAQAMLTQPDLPRPNVARPESDASQTSAAQSDKRLSSYSPEPQVFFPQQFDTVVDTFGLCSHKDPVAALKQMAAACKLGGQLILLQHGKGSWEWLNRRLDLEAEAHHTKWGCWWNRDILQLVQQAGLSVESCTRFHFGTTYVIKARPA